MEAYDKIKKSLAVAFMNDLDNNRPEGKMCLSNGEFADIEKAFNEQDWPKLARYLDKYTESEDERIRKDILRFLKAKIENCTSPTPAKSTLSMWIAYLEKQKEPEKEELVYRLNGLMQEYINEGEDEDEKEHRFKCYKLFWDALEDASYFEQQEQELNIELIQRSWYMEGYSDREFGKEPKWILKTGEGGPKYELNPRHGYYIKDEQKSAEYDDIKKIVLEDFGLCDNGYDPMNVLMTIKRKWPMVWKTMLANESANAKPVEWSEEDDWKRKELIQYLEEKGDYRTVWMTWLKSLRPVKQEWSEEDEHILKGIIGKIDHDQTYGVSKVEMLSFLEGLRPSWKPSEEQIECLRKVVHEAKLKHDESVGGYADYQFLRSLLQELIKQL